ncbi:hypothetical protein [Pedobacter nototheniae]|uniref:hypothetical protein n=1 Tax=Pedobacter nototheniae TaxID=2488994 RepID=UPI0029310229|nr:hypothetical protein [Pedobacter nototheniae]
MEISSNTFCNCCYKPYSAADSFCFNCGFPLHGTEQEQKNFVSLRSVKEIELQESGGKIDSARKSLYWIGGLIAFWTVIAYFMNAESEDAFPMLITNIILVGAFLGLAVWSKTKPAAALISGLSLFILVQILNAVVSPVSIFSGIIFKIIVIGYLIKGIKAVLEVDKLKKELNLD